MIRSMCNSRDGTVGGKLDFGSDASVSTVKDVWVL